MRKSFTLIELMLAIIILSVLILAMNNIILNLKSTKDFLKKILEQNNKKELLIKTFYYDMLNAVSIKIKPSVNSNYDRIYMQTQNSLYHLIFPYVIWYVSKNGNALIRIESPFKIKLPDEKAFFLDKFGENIKIFKIFKKDGKDLIFIQAEKPVYFEMIDKDLGIKTDKNTSSIKKFATSASKKTSEKNEIDLPTF